MTRVKMVLEHSTPEQVDGLTLDGMEYLLGDDITGSEYEAHQDWPGVPNVTLPEIYKKGMPDVG